MTAGLSRFRDLKMNKYTIHTKIENVVSQDMSNVLYLGVGRCINNSWHVTFHNLNLLNTQTCLTSHTNGLVCDARHRCDGACAIL